MYEKFKDFQIAILGVCLAVGIIFASIISKPLQDVSKAAKQITDGNFDVEIKVTVYFTHKDCYDDIKWQVGAKKVRCFRMNRLEDMSGFEVPFETQYAMKLESTGNIVVQYGRLDNTQPNLAFYTTLGYAEQEMK